MEGEYDSNEQRQVEEGCDLEQDLAILYLSCDRIILEEEVGKGCRDKRAVAQIERGHSHLSKENQAGWRTGGQGMRRCSECSDIGRSDIEGIKTRMQGSQ